MNIPLRKCLFSFSFFSATTPTCRRTLLLQELKANGSTNSSANNSSSLQDTSSLANSPRGLHASLEGGLARDGVAQDVGGPLAGAVGGDDLFHSNLKSIRKDGSRLNCIEFMVS